MTVKEILETITYIRFEGDENQQVEKVVPLNQVFGIRNALTWCSDENTTYLESLSTNPVVVISKNAAEKINNRVNYLVVENPRRTFREILTHFFAIKREANIHPSAIIAKNCKIGENIFIGHHVVIEENCEIGDNVTILHNTVILRDTVIGNNVTIGANNTIGGMGFGYEKNPEGDFELIPHIGNVIIKDHVDIGNNTCIDRAVLGSTRIEENVKIDNLVHIAHGVTVGRNSVIIANAMVAGSVVIGENAWVAPSSSVLNKKKIGNHALVGLGAVVIKDVDDFSIVAGNPAKEIRKATG